MADIKGNGMAWHRGSTLNGLAQMSSFLVLDGISCWSCEQHRLLCVNNLHCKGF